LIDLKDILTIQSGPEMTTLVLLLAIPLLSFVISGVFKTKGPLVSTLLIGLNLILAIQFLLTHIHAEPQVLRGEWFRIGDYQFTYSFIIDELMLLMGVVVNFISLLVHVFSLEYMRQDQRIVTYFRYLGLFTFSMMGIVLFYDLLIIFIFWELVGLSSYLLIGFWFKKKAASLAANKAFILNRIGDVGFITGIMILFTQFGSLDLEAVKSLMILSEIDGDQWVVRFLNAGEEIYHNLDGRWLSGAGIALFCGAVGKSAQFPLQVWLPDAMEGPTPVSALIHAATMVAAGVYLLARIFVILDAQALEVVAIVGAITAFMAAIAAISQFDIKKVLAYSTVSQLGYMVMAMGVGAYSASIFHLFTHAFFKAGLFLSAGVIIHQLHKLETEDIKFDVQDMRVMGGLRQYMPKTYFVFLLCALALVGLPGFTGFLSKDEILLNLSVWTVYKGGGFYIPQVLAFATVVLTAFYTFRMIFLVFFGEFRIPKLLPDVKLKTRPQDGNALLMIPVIILAALSTSLWLGLTLDGAHTWLSELIKTPMYLVPEFYAAKSLIDVPAEMFEDYHYIVMGVSLALALAGIVMAYLAFKPGAKMQRRFVERKEPKGVFGMVSFYHWYQDVLYQKVLLPFFLMASKCLSWFDEKVIDRFVVGFTRLQVVLAQVIRWFDVYVVDGLVHFTAASLGKAGQVTRSIQSGRVQSFIIFSFIFVLLILLLLVF
jgi:NADH-quinone oxidoreductase subunit L